MNEFRLDRGFITVIVGQATAAGRADGNYVRLDVEQAALESETVVELTPEEAMLVAEALWNRATQALKDRPEPPQWKALRQTKDMMGGDWGIGNAA